MIDRIRQIFYGLMDEPEQPLKRQNKVTVAVCALFLEMAKTDEIFSPQELEMILRLLQERYGLSGESAKELMAEAERALEESVDLWQFARLINETYDHKEKLELIEMLWNIVFVDERMDKYENYLMHKLSNLLNLSHRELMDVKLKVLRIRIPST